MAVNNVPWQEVRRDYLAGATYQELGEKYGVSPSTVGRRRHKEDWGDREEYGEALWRSAAMVRQLSAAVESSLASHAEPWGIKELKDLSALIREVIGLQRLVAEAAGEDAAEVPPEAEGLRVVLEGPLEQWGE